MEKKKKKKKNLLAPCVPPMGQSTLLGPRTCSLLGQFREIKRFSKIAKKVCPEHGGPLSALRAGWTSPVADEKKKKKKNPRKYSRPETGPLPCQPGRRTEILSTLQHLLLCNGFRTNNDEEDQCTNGHEYIIRINGY